VRRGHAPRDGSSPKFSVLLVAGFTGPRHNSDQATMPELNFRLERGQSHFEAPLARIVPELKSGTTRRPRAARGANAMACLEGLSGLCHSRRLGLASFCEFDPQNDSCWDGYRSGQCTFQPNLATVQRRNDKSQKLLVGSVHWDLVFWA
jgi:hypothetical protein